LALDAHEWSASGFGYFILGKPDPVFHAEEELGPLRILAHERREKFISAARNKLSFLGCSAIILADINNVALPI
jgi:hypothetical protein